MQNRTSRGEFLAVAGSMAASAGTAKTVIIDTHFEVRTFGPRFPFHRPEHPELKRVPIENESRSSD
jgi:hypothetical protein